LLSERLSHIRDVQVGILTHASARLSDFYRELGDIFAVALFPHNRWQCFKNLRERWLQHMQSTLLHPVAKTTIEVVKETHPEWMPRLMSAKGTVRDYSGRTISNLTLLQAAACAGDIEMCVMLTKYLSSKEITKQLTEIFPNGLAAHAEEQKRTAFDFSAIINAISDASDADLQAAFEKEDNGSPLCLALDEFRRAFTERSQADVAFNLHHVMTAIQKYNSDEIFITWQNESANNDQSRLYWLLVIGFTYRFLPMCYFQAITQGMHELVPEVYRMNNSPEPLCRTIDERGRNAIFFGPRSGLGFDHNSFDDCARENYFG